VIRGSDDGDLSSKAMSLRIPLKLSSASPETSALACVSGWLYATKPSHEQARVQIDMKCKGKSELRRAKIHQKAPLQAAIFIEDSLSQGGRSRLAAWA
jgi:hypothetical protein